VSFVPCHAFDAPAAGSGKSKLVDCCSIVLTGRECAVVSQATDDTEFEKKLGAVLLAGDPLVSIDNCTEAIDNQLLCMITTQRLVQIRILGRTKTMVIPNNAFLFATGNNFRFAGDMLRRGLVGRLDAEVDRPELRTFTTEDPILVFKRERPRLVVAALTALRSYIHAGRPEPGTPLGGFEEWSRLVRDCLVWLGEEDPVQTIEAAREEDPQLLQFEAVIAQWEIHFGRRRVATKDVVGMALQREGFIESDKQFLNPELRQALLAVAGNDGRIDAARLGKWLGKHKNRVAGGRRIIADGIVDGIAQWRMQFQRGAGWE
jgi:putative DNA primase/helicase